MLQRLKRRKGLKNLHFLVVLALYNFVELDKRTPLGVLKCARRRSFMFDILVPILNNLFKGKYR